MMADYNDFTFQMWRGDTEVFDAAITVAGVAVNITGCSLKFTAKRSLQDSDADAVFQLATPSEIVITDGPNGLCQITVASADTSGLLVPTLCYCDLQLVDTLGNVSTTATGTLLIKVDVTRTDT
jgi:hypothetical protein